VEAWIVCEETAYRFHISNLYKEVLPDQCYFKVSQRSQRVTLILKKYETNPWRFLRS
jgi:elongation factor P hydroxylase